MDGMVEGATTIESLDNWYGYIYKLTVALGRPTFKDKQHILGAFQEYG